MIYDVPDYYKPWPDDSDFDDSRPDYEDDMEVKRKCEDGFFDDPEFDK